MINRNRLISTMVFFLLYSAGCDSDKGADRLPGEECTDDSQCLEGGCSAESGLCLAACDYSKCPDGTVCMSGASYYYASGTSGQESSIIISGLIPFRSSCYRVCSTQSAEEMACPSDKLICDQTNSVCVMR
jgi:hypothetical protein